MLPSKKGRKEKKILLSPAARPKQTKKKELSLRDFSCPAALYSKRGRRYSTRSRRLTPFSKNETWDSLNLA